MLKVIIISILIILILIGIILLDSKFGIFEKFIWKIKDFFDVIKYKRKANSAINKYNARNEEYIDSLKTVQRLTDEKNELQNQIISLKEDKKELKRIIAEEMTPKKKKVK